MTFSRFFIPIQSCRDRPCYSTRECGDWNSNEGWPLRFRWTIALLVIVASIIVYAPSSLVHGSGPLGENYSLGQSATRIQETDTPGVSFVLNVTSARAGLPYTFAWAVADPSGTVYKTTTSITPSTSSFNTMANFPTSFSARIRYVGSYRVSVNQTSPPAGTNTPAGSAQFQVELTDALEYQRTMPVSLTAQGFAALENVTIDFSSTAGHAAGFPTIRPANSAGVLSFTWTAIPYNAVLGNYTVRLTPSTPKIVPDMQMFKVDAANVAINQLSITQNSLERSQTEGFRFVAVYPSGQNARTGSALIRVIEPDGVTEHDITATYKTTIGEFEGFYQIPLSSPAGSWVASIDILGFNDGYGNVGPLASVPRAFAVSTAILTIAVTTSKYNYTTGNVVAIAAHVVTPGGANFTGGSVNTVSLFSGHQVRAPMALSYDQTRGVWVGSYTLNSTDLPGVWIVQVNATDAFGNSGSGSTSMLYTGTTTQPPGQSTQSFLQMLTSNYLLALVIVLAAALGIVGSWIVYRRGRVSRRVLKVDLEAVHSEAAKVENNEFFRNVQEQLKDMRKDKVKG